METSQALSPHPSSATKLYQQPWLWQQVQWFLRARWSPQQIARKLKQMSPSQPQAQVSHETIYTAIYAMPRGQLRKELIGCLRKGRAARKARTP